MKNILKLSIAVFLISMFAIGCQKQIQPDQATGEDIRNSDLAVSDVFTFAAGNTDLGKSSLDDSSCITRSTIMNDDSSFTTTITFNPDCNFEDGIVRSGQIIITWQKGWRFDSSKYATVTFNNFTRNDKTLSGNIKISNISGTPSLTNPPVYKIVENNMKLEFADGKQTTWEGIRTVEWMSGFNTPRNRTDDVRKVKFNKDGVNRNGAEYTATGKDLIIDNTCGNTKRARITSGTITIIKNNIKTIVNFGDGECDNSYTVTQNGITITINN